MDLVDLMRQEAKAHQPAPRSPYRGGLPGWKDDTTSREAALDIAKHAAALRFRALEIIKASSDGLTPDEVAARMGSTPFSIRPRCTELRSEGFIVRTGKRRNGCHVLIDKGRVG